MAKNYKGDNGVDIVNQNNNPNNDYFNIYTYGGADQISLTLSKTFVDAGAGADTVTSNIENDNNIKLGGGNDTYIGNGFSSNDNKYDIVVGNGGNDTFTVATAVSEYYGDSGNDTFNSAGYFNYFNGGSGNDTISYQRQDTDNYLKGRGVKVDLYEHYATTGAGREEKLVNIENATGTSYDDTLHGTDGKNVLLGMDGLDVLKGGGGNDTLDGGRGGDNIYAGAGSDRLIGGLGTDFLEGGSGKDTFVFESIKDSVVSGNRDVISDFSSAQNDRIDLSAIDAVSGGSDDSFDFIGASNFSGTAGELRFRNQILSGDVDGDGKADFEVKVDQINTMHSGDFIL